MPIVQENVGYLQISVDNVFLSEVVETIEYIFNDVFCSVFVEIAIFS